MGTPSDKKSPIDLEPMSYHRRMLKEMVAKKIAGDILFSPNVGKAMRKWREYFGIKQSELSRLLGISASVISDYESGRRKSPGSLVLRRFIKALITRDEEKGGEKLKLLSRSMGIAPILASIVDMLELAMPVPAEEFLEAIDAVLLTKPQESVLVHGYTIIDSIKAIECLSGVDFMKIFGSSTERALIFTKVSTGRSPMVALRVFDMRPSLVVLHGLKPEDTDKLAIRLADIMKVPLAVSRKESITELVDALRERFVEH